MQWRNRICHGTNLWYEVIGMAAFESLHSTNWCGEAAIHNREGRIEEQSAKKIKSAKGNNKRLC